VIPEGGLNGHVKDEDMCLSGHTKKALSVRWHNSVENLIATAAIDNTVKIWDVTTGQAAHNFNFANFATSM
jgi:WD40 repeat protein